MPDEEKVRWRDIVRSASLTGILALATGYAVFHTLFPMASYPVEGDPSLLPLALVLVVPAFLVGLASADISPMIFQAFLAPVLGYGVSVALVLSPVLMGLYSVAPDAAPGFVLHYAFVFLAAALFVNFLMGLVGLGIRNYFLSKIPRPPPWALQRK